ncbi:MAG: ribosome biogenesis GTPase Der [Phycisphaerales bacterium]|nr:ribosome biogenesis GTPase Der [Phycisphaerales bacterium]
MPLPRIAIVGRPNVGKSSLMNMLAKDKVSIVDPTPGVTRDRVNAIVVLEPPDARGPMRTVELTDTGGYGVYTAEGKRFDEVGADLSTLTHDIEGQISMAVATADIVLFIIDTQAGVTTQDEHIAQLLRERVLGSKDRPNLSVMVVANKVDGPRWEPYAYEAASLGFGDPVLVSAKNNFMRRNFVDNLYEAVGTLPNVEDAENPEAIGGSEAMVDMKLAIVGKRNSGKSSLVNALAGQQRVIVSEIAGTTRDAIDVRFEMDGRTFLAIDTAGVRKKKSFQDRVEWFAFDRVQRAVNRADVVLLLLDAAEGISQIDQQVAALALKHYKPVVIVVNKWDLAEGRKDLRGRAVTTHSFETYIRKELRGLSFAPIAFISVTTGLNIRRTIDLAFDLQQQALQRVTTGKLNRLVRSILERRGPTTKLGTFAKVYYVSQIQVAPPTIGLVVNRPEIFDPGYERFLINEFRETLPFPEVPIKIVIKGRKRDAEDHMALRSDFAHESLIEVDDVSSLDAAKAAEFEAELLEGGNEAAAYFDDDSNDDDGDADAPEFAHDLEDADESDSDADNETERTQDA